MDEVEESLCSRSEALQEHRQRIRIRYRQEIKSLCFIDGFPPCLVAQTITLSSKNPILLSVGQKDHLVFGFPPHPLFKIVILHNVYWLRPLLPGSIQLFYCFCKTFFLYKHKDINRGGFISTIVSAGAPLNKAVDHQIVLHFIFLAMT